MRAIVLRHLAAVALPLLTVSCLGSDQGPPPVTALKERPCTSDAELAGPQTRPLSIGATLTVSIDAAAPCWTSPTGESVYAAFLMPETATPFVIKVLSEPVGQTLFVPRLILRGADGQVRREIPRDSFLSRGAALYAAIRARPDERYLIVASDPSTAGQRVTHTFGRTTSTMVATGTMFIPIYAGRDSTTTYTYAHNGGVTISLEPLPAISR